MLLAGAVRERPDDCPDQGRERADRGRRCQPQPHGRARVISLIERTFYNETAAQNTRTNLYGEGRPATARGRCVGVAKLEPTPDQLVRVVQLQTEQVEQRLGIDPNFDLPLINHNISFGPLRARLDEIHRIAHSRAPTAANPHPQHDRILCLLRAELFQMRQRAISQRNRVEGGRDVDASVRRRLRPPDSLHPPPRSRDRPSQTSHGVFLPPVPGTGPRSDRPVREYCLHSLFTLYYKFRFCFSSNLHVPWRTRA
mmetsp:Transcript_15836/g.45301  ORF Transcript_15836/g.45301 Transcript_15836/m.45301 type:complete len:255 (+) Transcript_15836:1584-2348(+)